MSCDKLRADCEITVEKNDCIVRRVQNAKVSSFRQSVPHIALMQHLDIHTAFKIRYVRLLIVWTAIINYDKLDKAQIVRLSKKGA